MARSPLNIVLLPSTSYTVPTGKTAILRTAALTASNPEMLLINGQQMALIRANNASETQTNQIKPICVSAGDAISAAAYTDGIVLSGFLYDAVPGRETVNFSIGGGDAAYTVPAGKMAVLSAFRVDSSPVPTVNGQSTGHFGSGATSMVEPMKPICVPAGGVIGITGGLSTPRIGFSGFLYSQG